ncbi:phage tail tape measure protein [Xenorhabdus stockiae]|uniref:Phage tail tape measure protein n=1 Tax=Xenorhabdus stockiae TaxID=351614 RepID=A0A2D0KL96_9GAMM|nr:phage tail tape measure protein [Xenorhabdus stockiae]PHM64211.1 phage tail tape measure protein [Xenorhabdus stockiae]
MSQLDFILNLINRVTEPLDNLKNTISGVAEESQKAFGKISAGGQTIADAFWSTHSFLEPAIQMDEALKTASLQGIDSSVMAKIANDSVTFSSQYGKSAIDFVNSAAEINKAVQGLEQTELPQMTKIANTTAVALKASSTDAANYMGKMFALFSGHAQSVGNLQFAEELSGKAVFMAQTFGTSMPEMTKLLEDARKAGTNFGVGIDEQLAVLGQLQETLGGDASRAYEAFLSVAADGGKSLGLSFVNAYGQMLSMPEILAQLQAKYGSSIEGNLKAQAEIEAAFGDSAVVVKALFNDVDALNKNMAALGANDGMDRTYKMAAQMADPWERLQQIWQNLHILIGSALLPVIKPLVNWLADTSQVLVRWMKLFPNIARWVGYITLVIMNFAAIGAMANIVMGVSKLILIGLRGVMAGFTLLMQLGTVAVWLYRASIFAWNIALRVLQGTLLVIRGAAILTGLAFSFMSWPILLLIAVIAGLVFAVIKFWQPIKAFISGFIQGFSEASDSLSPLSFLFGAIGRAIGSVWNAVKVLFSVLGGFISLLWNGIKGLFGWFAKLLAPIQYTDEELKNVTEAGSVFGRVVAGAIGLIMLPINLISYAIGGLAELFSFVCKLITGDWNSLGDLFKEFTFVKAFLDMVDGIKNIFSGFFDWLSETFGEEINSVINTLNHIPFVNIETIPIEKSVTKSTAGIPNIGNDSQTVLTGGKKLGINRNGLMSEVANNSQTVNDNSRRIESVTFNVANSMTPDQFTEWEQVAYG